MSHPTKESIQQEYQKVAAQAGDLHFQLAEMKARLAQMESRMGELYKARKSLQEQLATIKDDQSDAGQTESSAPAP